ncbi:hypothetical protein IK110_01795 [Candidatus Saccharibacteria bacterium]|nr:hypothetical protein [Candidatus Saccharibacteria bacterium]
MPLFGFGRKASKFDRNYYGELCEKEREKSILEADKRKLLEENADLRRRLSAYEKVEPETSIGTELPAGEVWLVPSPFEGRKQPQIRIEEVTPTIEEENDDTECPEDDASDGIAYDVEILPDGSERELGRQPEQARPAIIPLRGDSEKGLKAGLS